MFEREKMKPIINNRIKNLSGIRNFALRIINFFVPKKNNSYFFEPQPNTYIDKQDLINYSGDSVLTFLNYLKSVDFEYEIKVWLVIYFPERIPEYENWIGKDGRIVLHYVVSENCYSGIKRKVVLIKNLLRRFRCINFVCSTPFSEKRIYVRRQNLICLNYFSSFKSDFGTVDADLCPKNWKLICTNSMLDSTIQSSAFYVPYDCFKPLGLPRNDILYSEYKRKPIIDWIIRKISRIPERIIVYAPTFRDYERDDETMKRNIWGYEDSGLINDVLKQYDAIVIAKLHAWQNISVIDEPSDNVILFEPNFEFSIYDLMVMADLFISDYSSIGVDFLMTSKPIIYNLYDLDEYMETRGMSFEPIDFLYAGSISKSELELAESIRGVFEEEYDWDKYNRVKRMLIKHHDGECCKRVFDYLREAEVF